MSTTQLSVFFDQAVAGKVIEIIDEAKQFAVIVTPYLDLWRHAESAIERAAKRRLDLRIIVRNDKEVLERPEIEWLSQNGAKVYAVDWLHAKIYLNEQSVLIASMNFTERSVTNSHEIAYLLREQQDIDRVREYVRSTIMVSATPIKGDSSFSATQASSSGARNRSTPVHQEATIGTVIKNVWETLFNAQPTTGFCIRCGRNLYFNPEKPLCERCFQSWNQYGDPNYAEKFCHSCGKPDQVSYARPRCSTCYTRQR